jgi:hypothetical protein
MAARRAIAPNTGFAVKLGHYRGGGAAGRRRVASGTTANGEWGLASEWQLATGRQLASGHSLANNESPFAVVPFAIRPPQLLRSTAICTIPIIHGRL